RARPRVRSSLPYTTRFRSGLDVEVATYVVNAIAADNDWDEPSIDWRETPSGQRETLIQNGEVDMITGTYSINPGRFESGSHADRSEEHTSELQSRFDLVCR